MKILTSLLLCVLLLTGCSGMNRSTPRSEAILDQVEADPDIRPFDITISDRMGHLTLTGTVGSESARKRVEEIALATVGVESVNNMIQVVIRERPVRNNKS